MTGQQQENPDDPWTASLYAALRSQADQLLVGRGAACLNASDLVQEAWLRLRKEQQISPADRRRFLGLARRVLRRVLNDHFKHANRQKRGGQLQRVTFTNHLAIGGDAVLDAMDLLDVVEPLEKVDPRGMAIFDLAYFGGLSLEEIAADLNMALDELTREWDFVKKWLLECLKNRRRENRNT